MTKTRKSAPRPNSGRKPVAPEDKKFQVDVYVPRHQIEKMGGMEALKDKIAAWIAAQTAILLILLAPALVMGQTITQEALKAETKPKGEFTAYEAANGHIYSIGDKLKTGHPAGHNGSFLHILEGNAMVGLVQSGSYVTNIDAEIKKINVSGSKRAGWKVQMTCKHPTGMVSLYIYLEDAIAAGEVIPEGYTREKAIKELKEAKDLLDLGIITQAEFDQKKEELTKYIK